MPSAPAGIGCGTGRSDPFDASAAIAVVPCFSYAYNEKRRPESGGAQR